ncbi:hypothetical protein SFRURICE_001491 [Spodoptera frugiperda]|nr:hypothetical protein SFRURICE_001491 [Spodoptera frugiperda]
MFLTWASFNNIRMLMMACMPVVIFYLIWLVNTSEGIRSEEGTLLDLVCWPDGNAIPVIIACGSIIAVVIELYAKIKGGITKAMLRYSSHLPSKVAIDRLQTRFHCCGRVNFQEWFFIPWYMNGENIDSKTFSNHKFVSDNVPYSCCSTEELYPCIHHGVTQMGTIYKYNPATQLTIWNAGCEEKLISEMMTVSWRFNAVMALIIIAMIMQVVAVRYLHTAYRSGLHVGNQITCKAYLLRSLTDTEPLKDQSRKKVFKKRKFRQARTLHWVSVSYRRGKKRYLTSSGSDINSSDELLKPIYE